MLSVMRSYMQTCHFILLNNNCLFINGTKLVKTSRLFRFTCIVCGIQCSEMNYILLGVHLRCSYFAAKKEKWLKPFSMAQPSLIFPLVGSTFRMYKEYRCVYSPNYLLNWNDVIPWSIVRIL